MKKYLLILSIALTLSITISGCKSKDNDSNTENNSSTESTTEEPTTEEPTTKKVLTSQEKADIFFNLINSKTDSTYPINASIDEFTKDVSVLPGSATEQMFKGDKEKDSISLLPYLYKSIEGDYSSYDFALTFFTSNSWVFAEKLYLKTDTDSIVLNTMKEMDKDINVGYVQESHLIVLSSSEIAQLTKMFSGNEQIRIRISGSGSNSIDATIPNNVKNSIYDYFDIYNKYIEAIK